jgi:AbrB family looped-hinge helix DNA binding protein
MSLVVVEVQIPSSEVRPTTRSWNHNTELMGQNVCFGMKTVEIDTKGRVVIPKEIREESGISTPGELVVKVEGEGKISLQSIEMNLRKAQQIGRRKLSSWREGRHEEDKLALKLAREENHR